MGGALLLAVLAASLATLGALAAAALPLESPARRLLAAAFLAAIADDAVAAREPGTVPDDAVVRLLDEVVALWGTLEGCARERTTLPLRVAWETPTRA